MTEEAADMKWSDPEDGEAHIESYDAFMKLTKYGIVGVIGILVLMAVVLL